MEAQAPRAPRPQRRGARLALEASELDAFLARERVCRLATVGRSGAPHVSPVWFVWDGEALWINSIVRTQRWRDLENDPRASAVVDTGREFGALVGAELCGTMEVVGEVPRAGAPLPELEPTELLYARKYRNSDTFSYDGRHGWLRMRPDKIVSWDQTKVAAG